MTIDRALVFSILMVFVAGNAGPALAQTCTRQGNDVTCDDGRRGILSDDAIIWPDGTRSSLASSHPSVIIGHKPSVVVGRRIRRQGQWCRAAGEPERTGTSALPRARRSILLQLVKLHAAIDRV